MRSYQELLTAIVEAAAAIFADAKTEAEVCELEQSIYRTINEIAAARISELHSVDATI